MTSLKLFNLSECVQYCLVHELISVRCFRSFIRWSIQHINRECSAGDLYYRRIREMFRETFNVNRRRGDDNFEIGPLRQNTLQIAEQKIDIQASFVRLINDQCIVLLQETISLRLC